MRVLLVLWDLDLRQVNVNTFVQIPVLFLNRVRVVGVGEGYLNCSNNVSHDLILYQDPGGHGRLVMYRL